MAISGALLTTSGNATPNNAYTWASITPTANNLVIACVSNTFGVTPGTPTLAGNGLTWVLVGTAPNPAAASREMSVFRAMSATPTAGIGTITFPDGTQGNCSWSIYQFSGVDTSGANGANAIVQTVFGSESVTTDTTLSGTLGAFSSAYNGVAGEIVVGNTGGGTAGANFTGLGTETVSTTHISEWAATNIGTVTFGYPSTSSSKILYGCEIRAAGPNLVQTGTASATGTASVVFPGNVTTGNLIIISAVGAGSFTTVTDNNSNSYSDIYSGTWRTNVAGKFSYAANITGNTPGTVTIKNSGANTLMVVAREYSGLSTVPLDGKGSTINAASDPGTINSGTTGVTVQASEVSITSAWVSGVGTGNWTFDAGYSNGSVSKDGASNRMTAMQDNILSATGAQFGTFVQTGTTGFGNMGVIATFKVAGQVSAPSFFGWQNLTGVGQ